MTTASCEFRRANGVHRGGDGRGEGVRGGVSSRTRGSWGVQCAYLIRGGPARNSPDTRLDFRAQFCEFSSECF